MKIKLVDVNGTKYAALDADGLPIYVHDDGREIGFDAPSTVNKIAGLNKEAQTHRENYEKAQTKLKGYEGIDDPDAARNAMKTVGNLKAGDLKTAAQVAEIQEEARKAAERQVEETARQSANRITELEKERDGFQTSLYDEKVGGAFSRSKFISDRTTVPPDMLQAQFGKHFKIEDGKVVPYGHDGNKIYSQKNAGSVADFEEGLEHLINGYAHKGNILKGTGHSGTGAQPGNGGGQGNGGKPQITRQAWEGMNPTDKAAAVKTHTIVDAAA